MKPHTKSIIAALFCGLCAAAVSAQSEADFEVSLTEDGKGAVINRYTGKVTNTIKIPATIEGMPVREIGEEAFYTTASGQNYMSNVTATGFPITVILPPGLIKIGDRAFQFCALTSVVIPDSVTYIGSLAFNECGYYAKTGFRAPRTYSLTSVTLPKGLTTVGERAFYYNEALKTVVIPNGVPVIGEEMFSGCSALTAITIPDSVTSIGKMAFANTGLTGITFGKKVVSIGKEAFSGCKELKTITIPAWVTEIGEDAFRECSALTAVTIPDSVESMQLGGTDSSYGLTLLEGAFRECGKLNLATQARLKKIAVTTAYEINQAREQREQEERRAQEQRKQKEWEAQLQREREEREAQAEREREERLAKEQREREQAQRAKETVNTLSARLSPIYGRASMSDAPTKQQFNEFIAIYSDYLAAKNDYNSLKGGLSYSDKLDLDFGYENLEKNIEMIIRHLDAKQKKTFVAKFGEQG